MFLRRDMSAQHERGLADGRAGRRRDPARHGEPGADGRPLDWSYAAGWHQGAHEWRMAQARELPGDPTVPCDHCEAPSTFEGFAAYETDTPRGAATHPTLARYPMPQARACTNHLGALVARDLTGPGSTRRWLIAPVREAWRLFGDRGRLVHLLYFEPAAGGRVMACGALEPAGATSGPDGRLDVTVDRSDVTCQECATAPNPPGFPVHPNPGVTGG